MRSPSDIERRPTAVGFAPILVGNLVPLVAAVVVLVAGPWESTTTLLYALFFLPVGLAVPRALWSRAYPDPPGT